jgi:hypothetical protein
MHMRVCYPDYHEAGLCCYLVMHIENILHQLQLFYFHLRHYVLALPRISVSIAILVRSGQPGNRGSISGKENGVSLLHKLEISSGSRPPSYSMGIEGSFPGGETAGT